MLERFTPTVTLKEICGATRFRELAVCDSKEIVQGPPVTGRSKLPSQPICALTLSPFVPKASMFPPLIGLPLLSLAWPNKCAVACLAMRLVWIACPLAIVTCACCNVKPFGSPELLLSAFTYHVALLTAMR